MDAVRARSWTCERCGVSVRFRADVDAPLQPNGWLESAEGWHCLGCRRDQELERARAEADADAPPNRRLVMTEFELARDPVASDRLIAKRVRCPTATVAPIRAAMLETGRLPAEPET
jgi:hypothetical protein